MSERSDVDKRAVVVQQVDPAQTNSSSPRLNVILDPVNGRQSKGLEKDLIISEANRQSPCSNSQEERMSTQTIEGGGRMANGQETPSGVDEVENEESIDIEADGKRVCHSITDYPLNLIKCNCSNICRRFQHA